jgi:hypothetical protein
VDWVVALTVVVLLGVLLSWTAGRVDRLHTRLEAARAALDAQLARRAAVAVEVAASGVLDPATSLMLADAAHRARTAGPIGSGEDRETAESDLSKALAAGFSDGSFSALRNDPEARPAVEELLAVCRRVQLARRFHNDAVRVTQRLRRKPLVRWLGLAGRAPWPTPVEFDDQIPTGTGV